jgi:hypothetical protein
LEHMSWPAYPFDSLKCIAYIYERRSRKSFCIAASLSGWSFKGFDSPPNAIFKQLLTWYLFFSYFLVTYSSKSV